MNFAICRNLKGCKIDHDGSVLIYTPKLFSMTGSVVDSFGSTLATMKRKGWMHYSFQIETDDDHRYVLNRKWGNTELKEIDSSTKFQSNGTYNFFSEQLLPATKFTFKKHFMNNWMLEVLQKEHWQALLIASCFIHKLDIQDNGA